VVAQNRSGSSRNKISPVLRERIASTPVSTRTVKVVLQFNSSPGAAASAILSRANVRVRSELRNLNAKVVELPESAVNELADLGEVSFVSPDRQVESLGHLSGTTGADLARAESSAQGTNLDGTGVGIAVLDSGIYKSHKSFLDRSGRRRIIFGGDFTGENTTEDPYGHGTHVSSIAAGNGQIAKAAYLGIAPNANIINLRVLNSAGLGTASGVLSALDWVLSNRAAYGIRVVNMSLGMPAIDSYKQDPVCRAVRRLVDAGIVVVVAAGNNGKDGSGNRIREQALRINSRAWE